MPDDRLERTRRVYRMDIEPESAGVTPFGTPYEGNVDELYASEWARLWRAFKAVNRRIAPLLKKQYEAFQ